MIITSNVTKNYGASCVVDGVSLQLPQGGITSIIGPNGAGKSTLLSMVSRLMAMDKGSVTVGGLDVTKAPSDELARRLSILRQDNHMTARLTVRDLVSFGRYPHSKGRLTLDDKVHIDRAIDYLDLGCWPTVFSTNCRVASGSAPSSPWCWRRTPITCCSTSRSTIST
jgi:iron complex transport system ATP-binding protein